MMAQELVTAVQEGIKLIVVLVQNHGFASIGALSESLGLAAVRHQLPVPRRRDRPAGRRHAAGRPGRQRREPRRRRAAGDEHRRAPRRRSPRPGPPSGTDRRARRDRPAGAGARQRVAGGTCRSPRSPALDSTEQAARDATRPRKARPATHLTSRSDTRGTQRMRTIEHWIGGKRDRRRLGTRTRAGLEPGDRRAAGRGRAGRAGRRRRRGAGRQRRRSTTGAQASLTPADQGPVRVPRAGQRATSTSSPRSITDEHGKVLSDARGEVQRGLEVVEFACGHPARCSRASTPTRSPPASTSSRSAQPLGVVRRHHAVQLPGHGADVDVPGRDRLRQHVRAQAERARPVGVDAGRRAVGRGRPAGRRLQRRARRQGRRRRAARPPRRRGGLVRRLDADRAVHPRAGHRATASGCRPSAAPRTTRSCCPTPTSTSPPTTSSRPRFGSAGERCMAISAAVAVGAAADALVDAVSREGRARSRSAPAATPGSEMGPVVTAAATRPDRRPDRHRRASRAPGSPSTAAACVVPGHEDGFFVGPDA